MRIRNHQAQIPLSHKLVLSAFVWTLESELLELSNKLDSFNWGKLLHFHIPMLPE